MITTILTTLWIAYMVVVAVWIALQRREPAATLAWILGLAALPYVGFAIYYVFGPRRIQRSRLRRLRARARLDAAVGRVRDAPGDPPPADALALIRLGTQMNGMPLSSCSNVRLLVDGGQTFEAIVAAIHAARHHVHVEYYIFVDDATGMAIIDALIERSAAGVEVRLLVDAVGVRLRRSTLKRMRLAGVELAYFHPVAALRLRPLVNLRTHRKIVVCDGVVGFTGGINVTADHDERINPKAFRDTHIRLEGLAVRWLQVVFLEDWHYTTNRGPISDAYFPDVIEPGTHPVQIVASGPDSSEEAILRMYFAAIASAETSVTAQTPYFVPDEAIRTALTTAALRGVDVRVMVPQYSDSRLVTAAARSYFDEMLRAGVRVYEYLPRMLHAKTLVVDGMFAAVGTANLDNRSFRLNFEVTAVVHGAPIAAELTTLFEADLEHCREVRLSERKRVRFPMRLQEALARLLSPLL